MTEDTANDSTTQQNPAESSAAGSSEKTTGASGGHMEHAADTTSGIGHGTVEETQQNVEADDRVATGESADTEVGGHEIKSKESLEAAAREHLISQTREIVIPSYSKWFDMNSITDVERKAMAEFFNSRNRSKTPTVYKDYRDFMINTYRLNPEEYLTVTACRRNLAGDVCAIMRVHAFLEQWGLINYMVCHDISFHLAMNQAATDLLQVMPEQRPSHVGPPFTGHFRIICDTPRGLQPWQPSADPTVLKGRKSQDTDVKAVVPVGMGDVNLEIGRNIYEAGAKSTKVSLTDTKANGDAAAGVADGTPESTSAEDNKAPVARVNCQQCGIDCTRSYWHSSGSAEANGKAKYELCPSCHLNGRFQQKQYNLQFFRTDNPTYTGVADRDAPWSDSEILRLLEALERYDDDWGEISDHVQTRTREECVLQFLQLDIEDKYLDPELPSNASTGLSLLGPQGRMLPFNQADNPVMSVICFLSSLADPAATAAAANKSADELKRNLRKRLEGGGGGGTGEGSNSKGKEKAVDDSMDLDVGQDAIKMKTTTTTTTTITKSSIASVPLASMGARAGGLASNEEREMTRLVSAASNVTLQKLELKLKYFNELEAILQAERRELERGRQQLFLDRLQFKQRVRQVQDGHKSAAASDGSQGFNVAQEMMGVGDRLAFQQQFATSVQPLSQEGQVKTYEA